MKQGRNVKIDATVIYKIRRTNIYTFKPSLDGGSDTKELHINKNSEALYR